MPDSHFLPVDDTPMARARFGQPEDVSDLINQYGTYNIQPTNEQENAFPMIAQALPTRWRGMEIHRRDMEAPLF
ncbi:MAG: hypothetical protein IJU66_05385 [Oscillospiraceae bacterium]|nr:hypothetical protein [Oscillospiraceae bacterium]